MRAFMRLWLAVAAMLLAPAQASAAVQITFYSHELGSNFPHAFITLQGEDGRTGEKIDANYGFTATAVTPAILLGSVRGEVFSRDPKKEAKYIAGSDPHFTLILTDPEYDAVLATIQRWRDLKQPSYNLNRQNCVHFVGHVAAAIGMRAEMPKALMKKPRSYTEHLTRSNLDWLRTRSAVIHREPKS